MIIPVTKLSVSWISGTPSLPLSHGDYVALGVP